MDKKDFSDLEDQIRSKAKNAFNYINSAKLKNDIDEKAEKILEDVTINLKSKSQQFNQTMESLKQNQERIFSNITKKNENELHKYISRRPVGSISGVFYMVLGTIGSFSFGSILIGCSIFISMYNRYSIGASVGLGFLSLFLLLSIALTFKGIYLRKRVKRFKQYVTSLNNRTYCSIEELSLINRHKKKFIIKDLNKMIDLNMFKEGHINEEQSYFMLSHEVYENYLRLQESLNKRNEEKLKREQEEQDEINNIEKKELRDVIETGKNYINQIRSVNDAIDQEEFSGKLYRLENIVSKIFNYLKENPKKLQDVHKFTTHYLPITLKLVNAYKELNDQPVHGENIMNAKNEIEKTIDTINVAFEKLLDDLFEEVALDISTDISVLETLLTQEGLTKNDFKK